MVPVGEASQVGDARRSAASFAADLGFDATAQGQVSIVASELAKNLVKHAGRGDILLRALGNGGRSGLELLSLDKGPGMTNVERCLGDGYSTAGTPGNGLGAVARLSALEIYSRPGLGTAIASRFFAKTAAGDATVSGAVCLPVEPEPVSGDAWVLLPREGGFLAVVADGLGHGRLAAEASVAAVEIAAAHPGEPPAELLERMHAALRATRGAAVAVAAVDAASGVLRYAGIGNISGVCLAPGAMRSLVTHNGIVGHELRRSQEFTYPWTPESTLVMYSDGLGSQWRVDRYPGLLACGPALLAGVLYRDFTRRRDDVTVLAVRMRS